MLSELTASKQSCGIFYLIFLQGLHHQRIILPELSKQLAPVRGPPEQDLICNNLKNSEKTDHATPVNINLAQCQQIWAFLPSPD